MELYTMLKVVQATFNIYIYNLMKLRFSLSTSSIPIFRGVNGNGTCTYNLNHKQTQTNLLPLVQPIKSLHSQFHKSE